MIKLHHVAVPVLCVLLGGCGSSSTDPDDVTPPFALVDLRAERVADVFVTLAWTAPGDDDRTGRASGYDLRYVVSAELTEANWPTATRVPNVPAPQTAGTAEQFRVQGLSASVDYAFGVKTIDDNGNASGLSNPVRVKTAAVPVQFLRHLGGPGTVGDPGAVEPFFLFPRHVSIDRQERVFITDERNDRVQRFDKDLKLDSSWGSEGDAGGQFRGPFGVGLNSNDRVYVVDVGNSRVQRFTSAGVYQLSFGGSGKAAGFLDDPRGIAVSLDERIYVADAGRVQEFTASGTFVRVLPAPDGAGWDPVGLTITDDDILFVTDARNHRVVRVSEAGTLERAAGSFGTGPGQFDQPVAVAVDPRGWVLVADLNNHRIQVFNLDLEFQFAFGTQGNGPGQLEFPHGVAVDPRKRVWVVEAGNSRVSVFDFP